SRGLSPRRTGRPPPAQTVEVAFRFLTVEPERRGEEHRAGEHCLGAPSPAADAGAHVHEHRHAWQAASGRDREQLDDGPAGQPGHEAQGIVRQGGQEVEHEEVPQPALSHEVVKLLQHRLGHRAPDQALPSQRPRSIASNEPATSPAMVSSSPCHNPKRYPPSSPTSWPGTGAKSTWSICRPTKIHALAGPYPSNSSLRVRRLASQSPSWINWRTARYSSGSSGE